MITTPSMSNTNPKHFSLEVFLQKGVLKNVMPIFFSWTIIWLPYDQL